MTDRKPRTLLHAFSTFRVGGPQIRFCTLANRFGTAYRHVIFAMDACYECRDRLAEGLDVTIAGVLAKKQDTLGNRGDSVPISRRVGPISLSPTIGEALNGPWPTGRRCCRMYISKMGSVRKKRTGNCFAAC